MNLINREKEHGAKQMLVNGESVLIDEKMMPVIRELNGVGLKTLQCCQGDDENPRCIAFDVKDMQIVFVRELNILCVRWNVPKGWKPENIFGGCGDE